MNKKKAVEYSKYAYKGLYDKAGVAYWTHPFKVAEMVESYGETYYYVALLHDVLEDTVFDSADLLDEGFSKEVVEAVEVLTKTDGVVYASYLEAVKENEVARVVKIADMTHNSDLTRLDEVTAGDVKRTEKYAKGIKYLSV